MLGLRWIEREARKKWVTQPERHPERLTSFFTTQTLDIHSAERRHGPRRRLRRKAVTHAGLSRTAGARRTDGLQICNKFDSIQLSWNLLCLRPRPEKISFVSFVSSIKDSTRLLHKGLDGA